MRPWNFPARKEARRVAAQDRAAQLKSWPYGTTARGCYEDPDCTTIEHARSIRTKIDRSAKGMFGL